MESYLETSRCSGFEDGAQGNPMEAALNLRVAMMLTEKTTDFAGNLEDVSEEGQCTSCWGSLSRRQARQTF